MLVLNGNNQLYYVDQNGNLLDTKVECISSAGDCYIDMNRTLQTLHGQPMFLGSLENEGWIKVDAIGDYIYLCKINKFYILSKDDKIKIPLHTFSTEKNMLSAEAIDYELEKVEIKDVTPSTTQPDMFKFTLKNGDQHRIAMGRQHGYIVHLAIRMVYFIDWIDYKVYQFYFKLNASSDRLQEFYKNCNSDFKMYIISNGVFQHYMNYGSQLYIEVNGFQMLITDCKKLADKKYIIYCSYQSYVIDNGRLDKF